MKILLRCSQCAAAGVPDPGQFLEMNYEGVYEFSCRHGHQEAVILPLQKFEVLFQMGSLAFLDGYPREAALDYAAALERFFEFAIMVFLCEQQVPKAKRQRTWKELSHQSERQLGAFYMLYLHVFNQVPPVIENKWVSFRNSVTHRGEIPTQEMAKAYAAYLWEYIIRQIGQMKDKCPNGLREYAVPEEVSTNPEANVSAAIVPTMISVLRSNSVQSFDKSLTMLEEQIQCGIFAK